MATPKIIDLEGLQKFKSLLETSNEEKFSTKEETATVVNTVVINAITTAFEEENHTAAEDAEVNSMLDDVFG